MKTKLFFLIAFMSIASILFAQQTINYQFDALNRVVKVSYPDGTVIDYTYDPLGNRTAKITGVNTVNQPDLIVSNFQLNQSVVTAGAGINVSCNVLNTGNAVAGTHDLKFYLSVNAVYESGVDVELISIYNNPVFVGGAVNISTSIIIPQQTTAGLWYILAFVDAADAVSESNENNNMSAMPITVLNCGNMLLSSVVSATSCGLNNGSVNITISGGIAPYSYLWNTGATTANIGNLAAGSYQLTVTDANNCLQSESYQISSSSGVCFVLNTTNPVCGQQNGVISATVTGGMPPYTYLWSQGATSQTISGLAEGLYTVIISDAANCQNSNSAVLTPGVNLSIYLSKTDASCGNANGSAMVQVTNGTHPYTYLWSNGQTAHTATNLNEGSISVTVTDAANCVDNASVIISNSAPISVFNVSSSNNSYCEGSQGVQILMNGSQTGVTYELLNNNNPVGQNITGNGSAISWTGVMTGNYTVRGTYSSCIVNMLGSVTVTEKPKPVIQFSNINHVKCNGQSNGSAIINVMAGTAPFSYTWSNGLQSAVNNNLAQGVHTVSVTDASACTNTAAIVINQPDVLSVDTLYTVRASSCSNNGQIMVLAQGGSSPYNYYWSTGQQGNGAFNLWAGTYQVSVTDANNCFTTMDFNVQKDAEIFESVEAMSHVQCNGGNTGFIKMQVSGGSFPYSYNWSNGALSDYINNLTAGIYTLTLTDNRGCQKTTAVTITEPDVFVATLTVQDASCDGSVLGAATINATGGTPPYLFMLNSALYNSGNFSGLPNGFYNAQVIDNNNCYVQGGTLSFFVNQDFAPVVNIYNGNSTYCEGEQLVLTANGNAAQYLWSNGLSGQSVTINAQTSSWVYVTATNTSNCSSVDSIYIQVNPLHQIDFSLTEICQYNSPVLLTDYLLNPAVGGIYQFSGNGIFSNVFYPSVVNVGTFPVNISYTDTITGCVSTKSQLLTVNGQPTVGLNLPIGFICENESPISLTGGFPLGGTYSGPGVNSATGTFNPAIAGAGTHMIFYTYKSIQGCEAIASNVITVHPSVLVSLTAPAEIWCTNNGIMSINVSPAGGYLTANGTPLAGDGAGLFWFQPQLPGMYNLVYQINSSQCPSFDTAAILVFPPPVVTLNAPVEVPLESSAFMLYTNPSGGQITVNGNPSGIMFDPAIWGVGTHTIEYYYEDTFSLCGGSNTKTIHVYSTSTGINDMEAEAPISIYPNPASNKIYIELSNNMGFDSFEIFIYDILGKSTKAQYSYTSSGVYEVDIKCFVKGTYFIEIRNKSNKSSLQKIIII